MGLCISVSARARVRTKGTGEAQETRYRAFRWGDGWRPGDSKTRLTGAWAEPTAHPGQDDRRVPRKAGGETRRTQDPQPPKAWT